MDAERPTKRTRQACVPCRRKKSKCSGDKPVCKTCRRLSQRCSYPREILPPIQCDTEYAEPAPRHRDMNQYGGDLTGENPTGGKSWEDRIDSLEITLFEVLQTLKAGPDHSLSTGSPQALSQSRAQGATSTSPLAPCISPPVYSPPLDHGATATPGLPTWDRIIFSAELYLRYCDNQPLPLFFADTFLESLPIRDSEILFAVLAAALRFDENAARMQEGLQYTKASQSLVMKRVANGQVELSTLQTLCMLALLHLHDGDSEMTIPLITMALSFAHGAGLQNEAPLGSGKAMIEERRRCYWSIVLLHRLAGISCDPPVLYTMNTPEHLLDAATPHTPHIPHASVDYTSPSSSHPKDAPADQGITVVVLRLSEVWSNVMAYVRYCRDATNIVSPWLTNSNYMGTMSSLMEMSQKLPPLHRYRHMQMRDLTPDDLESSREYWAPWLLSRFLYHTIICLLNHPLLVTLQQQSKKNVPELFIHQTSFYISHHIKWILHFIDFINSHQFRTTDPVIGYCAAVAATIQLQLSFSTNEDVKRERRHGFDTCLAFIRDLGRVWPSMNRIAKKLQQMTEAISVSFESSQTNPDGNISIDVSRFFDILDIMTCSSSFGLESERVSIYGSSLSAGGGRLSARPQRSELSQLPTITQPDEASVSGPSITGTSPAMQQSPDSSSNTTAANGVGFSGSGHQPQQRFPGADMMQRVNDMDLVMPAYQFFGGLSQENNTWWDTFSYPDPNLPS